MAEAVRAEASSPEASEASAPRTSEGRQLMASGDRVMSYCDGADEESFRRLHGLRDRYRALLAGMDKYLQSPEDSVGSQVVRARLLNVEMNSKELADLVGYSHTTVDMYLGEFLKEYYAGGTNQKIDF